jgi:hypothetical protein
MFCTDVRAALAQVHAALRPGGRFSVIVFGPPHANPCVSMALATARRYARMVAPDPHAPGSLFSLSQPGRIEALFRQAGFHHVAAETLAAVFQLPTTMDYLAFIRSSAGPLRQILQPLGPAAQERAWNQIARRLSVFQTPRGWQGPNQLLLCSGAVASAIL